VAVHISLIYAVTVEAIPAAAKEHGGDFRRQLFGGDAVQALHLWRKRPGRINRLPAAISVILPSFS